MPSTGQRLDSPSAKFVTAISSATPTFFIHWGYRSLMRRGTMAGRARACLMGSEKRTGEDPLELLGDAVCSAATPTASSCLCDSVLWPSWCLSMLAALWVCGSRCCCWRNWGQLGDRRLMTQIPCSGALVQLCRLDLASWCRVTIGTDNVAEPLDSLTRKGEGRSKLTIYP